MSDLFQSVEDTPGYGPWVEAQWSSECDECGDEILSGDEIRADGSGGWEGRCCDFE